MPPPTVLQTAGPPVPSPTPSLQRLQPALLGQQAGAPGNGNGNGNGETLTFPTKERFGKAGAPIGTGLVKTEEEVGFFPRLELPDPGELFRRDGEAQLRERMRQDARRIPGTVRVQFPEETPVSQEEYKGRAFPRMVELVEPSYVCHRRLLFEQPNFERYGWDFGIFQPGISLGIFYYDTLTLPYHVFSRPCQNYDCSAGKCLPGDPVPLLWYKEPFSLTGAVAQTATVIGGFFIFP